MEGKELKTSDKEKNSGEKTEGRMETLERKGKERKEARVEGR